MIIGIDSWAVGDRMTMVSHHLPLKPANNPRPQPMIKISATVTMPTSSE